MTVCGTLCSQIFNPLRPEGFWGPGEVLTCPDIFFFYNNNDIYIYIRGGTVRGKKTNLMVLHTRFGTAAQFKSDNASVNMVCYK